jgi:glycosyltransferase involved in cell wall biosynthesis
MKLCLLPDKKNWAYHSIALGCKKYNNHPDLDISIIPIKGNIKRIKKRYKTFDRFFVMGWQTYNLVKFLPKSSTLVGVHSFHSWDNRMTTPNESAVPKRDLIEFLNSFLRVNVVSLRLFKTFNNAGIEKLYYTPNGVDISIFKQKNINSETKRPFYVGYSGSKGHDWRKGITEFIIPSVKRVGAKTKLAMSASNNYIPLKKMPTFYQSLDAYLCASSSEGFSLSVLEAAATGLPIVSTRCSGTDELFDDNENVLLVDRNVDQMAKKIKYLMNNPKECIRLGSNIRKTIEENFTWKLRSTNWLNFINID